MANVQYTHHMGHAGYEEAPQASQAISRATFKQMTQIAGGVLSLVLIAGVGIWGYQLVKRDVTGIPVVRAHEGDMRVKPDNPGGQLALHQGLSVNAIAAEVSQDEPVTEVALAPKPTNLTEDDVVVKEPVRATAPVLQPEPLDVPKPLDSQDIDAIVQELTASVKPIETVDAPEDEVAAEPAVLDGAGLQRSLRPQLRPTRAVARPAQATVVRVAAQTSTSRDVNAAELPAGTRLVQLGAFASQDIARVEWDRLNSRFGTYLEGKDRLIQQAKSGGRTFYRLRAVGFADLSEARRFCSALVAEGADCIPVVTR